MKRVKAVATPRWLSGKASGSSEGDGVGHRSNRIGYLKRPEWFSR